MIASRKGTKRSCFQVQELFLFFRKKGKKKEKKGIRKTTKTTIFRLFPFENQILMELELSAYERESKRKRERERERKKETEKASEREREKIQSVSGF